MMESILAPKYKSVFAFGICFLYALFVSFAAFSQADTLSVRQLYLKENSTEQNLDLTSANTDTIAAVQWEGCFIASNEETYRIDAISENAILVYLNENLILRHAGDTKSLSPYAHAYAKPSARYFTVKKGDSCTIKILAVTPMRNSKIKIQLIASSQKTIDLDKKIQKWMRTVEYAYWEILWRNGDDLYYQFRNKHWREKAVLNLSDSCVVSAIKMAGIRKEISWKVDTLSAVEKQGQYLLSDSATDFAQQTIRIILPRKRCQTKQQYRNPIFILKNCFPHRK